MVARVRRPLKELDVTSNDACAVIRVAVVGEWVPPQLADVLARQRAEEPETAAVLVEERAAAQNQQPPQCGNFDLALSTLACNWPGWVCEPLWYDTLVVAVTKRSHLLSYCEVPRDAVIAQPVICVQSAVGEPWSVFAQDLLADAPPRVGSTVNTFDVAMTLVSAGYGIVLAPAKRVMGHPRSGVAVRPLADTPSVVTAFLVHREGRLTESQARFIRRARAAS